jgi:hypothetical protein
MQEKLMKTKKCKGEAMTDEQFKKIIKAICSCSIIIIIWIGVMAIILGMCIESTCHAAESCNPKKDQYRVMKATTNGGGVYYQVERCGSGGLERGANGIYEHYPLALKEFKRQEAWRQLQIRNTENYHKSVKKWERVQ